MSDWHPGDAPENLDIAIVGMAGRFPQAADLAQFWRNLRDGVEGITFFSDQELLALGVNQAALLNPNFVRAAPVLDQIDRFDAAFFGYSPREAELLDPQHRIFLECAWELVERTGYDPETYDGLIGVYAGTSLSTYLLFNLLGHPEFDSEDTFPAMISNDKDFLATRVSYELNLRGPSIDVQTGCSTSLVAVHLACQGLLNYQCDLALAGGVSVNVPQRTGYYAQAGGITSPDGHCRAFDAGAQGTLFGSGVGMVALKRLEDALNDGDTIHALIKGSAVNNDGSAKVGFTAPSADGQAEVIARAQAVAGIEPESISYVEAHGTGTALGDPVEVAALTRVFRADTSRTGFCGLGSVKSNIGHLDAAAGIAGLLKTVLALQHRQIPPSLHYETPNPKIDFAASPFYVTAHLADWPAGPTPRRAGVSSFGIGGTNAHLVLEEAPVSMPTPATRPWHLLLLSAKTEFALEAATANLAAYLGVPSPPNLADIAYTLQAGRKAFRHRRVLVCRDHADAAQALERRDPQRLVTAVQEPGQRSVVFLFPGGGAQYTNMGRELYQTEPLFREHVDRCAELLRPHLGLDLRDVLYPTEHRTKNKEQRIDQSDPVRRPLRGRPTDDPGEGQRGRGAEGQTDQSPISNPLTQTSLALPALFVVEYALAQVWMAWGVRPAALIGHSLGEYVAACLAGVVSLEDALALVVLRGRLFEQLPRGAMLSVALAEGEARALADGTLSLAAINAPAQCVLSGPTRAIEATAAALAEREVEARRIQIDVAAHSTLVELILPAFRAFVETIRLRPPAIPYLSNVTGAWMTAADATDPSYWVRHLRQTVRFSDGLSELLKDPQRVLLEVGPGRTLSTLAKLHPGARSRPMLSSIRHPYDRDSDAAFLLNTVGKLWLAGVPTDWAALYGGKRRRVPLPTYPFERQRFWIDPPMPAERAARAGKQADIADWCYIPSWKRSMPPKTDTATEPGRRWLVFGDERGVGVELAARLTGMGHVVTTVLPGARFAQIDTQVYTIDPRRRDEYGALLDELGRLDRLPSAIVHGWSITAGEPDASVGRRFEEAQDRGFYSLIFLAQALGEREIAGPLRLQVITSNVQQLESGDVVRPERATIVGPCRVIPQEYEQIACQLIDIALPPEISNPSTRLRTGLQSPISARLLDQLLAEITSPSSDTVIAYRGPHRWVQAYEPARLDHANAMSGLKQRGVYLITGGLGGVGLAFADELARSAQARLVLTGRTGLPARAGWEQWLAAHDEQDQISRKIGAVLALEATGAEVLVVSADVTDEGQMRAALAQAQERFGPIDGVIHAAGDPGGGVIQLKTPDMCAAVLAPKVQGTLVLDAIFKDAALDFLLLCSSLNAILAEVGQVDYCAANAFLDAFAQHKAAGGGPPVVSVDWNRWQGIGMAITVETMHQEITGRALEGGMTAQEGLEVFRRILARNTLPQLAISTQDLPTLLAQHQTFKLSSSLDELAAARRARPAHPRPDLANEYVLPGSLAEQTIAAIWQELLGIEQLGIHDNFFDLGGNSLIGIKVVARIKKELNVDITIVNLFEGPTVSALAALISQGQPGAPAFEESQSRGERRREKRLRKLRAAQEEHRAG